MQNGALALIEQWRISVRKRQHDPSRTATPCMSKFLDLLHCSLSDARRGAGVR